MAKGEKTRERILSAALDLFRKKGAHEVGFKEIAEKLGLTHAAIYRHFPDKHSLFLACTVATFEAGRKYVDAGNGEFDSADRKLRGLIIGNIEIASGARPAWVSQVLALHYYAQFERESRKLLATVTSVTTDRIERILIQGVREKLWAVHAPSSLAVTLHSLMLAEMFKASLEVVPKNDHERIWTTVMHLVRAKA